MIRTAYLASLLAALLAGAIPSAGAAEDAGFCKSMCGSERQECRATARKMTGNDDLLERSATEKNPFANTASHTQGQSEQVRVAGNASFQRRSRNAMAPVKTGTSTARAPAARRARPAVRKKRAAVACADSGQCSAVH